MMQQRRFYGLFALAVIAVLTFALSAEAWLPCDVSFIFMGKTKGNPRTLAFMEAETGECEGYHVRYLTLKDDSLLSDTAVYHHWGFPVPAWDTSLAVGDSLDYFFHMWQTNGVFASNFCLYTIRAPEHDSAFDAIWRTTYYEGATDQKMVESVLASNFDPPLISRGAELVWKYPNGLYKNYQITEVIITGGIAFIRTQGPNQRAEEPHNGLLIYHIE